MNRLKVIRDERSFVVLGNTLDLNKPCTNPKRQAIVELDCTGWPLGTMLPIVREEIHQLQQNSALLVRNCDQSIAREFQGLCVRPYFITHYCERHRTFAITYAETN